jgi:hypothetical protein
MRLRKRAAPVFEIRFASEKVISGGAKPESIIIVFGVKR